MQPSDIPAASAPEEIPQELTPEQLDLKSEATTEQSDEERLLAVLEAIVYVTDEPLSAAQIAAALGEPPARVEPLLERLVSEYNKSSHGVTVRELAGGYKMTTKAEHHEAIRAFVKNLKPPLKLSLAALETLAVIAYKQPITAPEVMEIRGVQGAGVLKTLLDRKLITSAGRKNVIGRPILYKTTKEFLVQFGLKNLNELPTLKEFEELRRLALNDSEAPSPAEEKPADGTLEAAATTPERSAEPEAPAEVAPDPEVAPDQQVEAAAEAEPASEVESGEVAEVPAEEEVRAQAEAPEASSDQ